MNFSYENQGGSTFLVYTVAEGERLDSMSVGMITNNKIPGLVKAVFTQIDAKKFIKYNVSSKIPVKQFFSGPISKKRLLGICHGIVDAILSAEEYMIDPNMIVIDTDYMFADVSTGETTLICLPVIQKEPQTVDFGNFFKHIMFTTQFDQTEDCDYVAKIINYLNRSSTFSPEQFKSLLTEISTGTKPAPAGVMSAAYSPAAGAAKPSAPKEEKKQPQIQPPPAPAAPKPVAPAPSVPPAPPAQPATGRSAPPHVPAAQPVQAQDTGEKISLFYLLQHYNKENAATYKAQKEQKKGQKGGKATPSASPAKDPAPKKKKKQKQKAPSYAIPGQSAEVPAAAATPYTPPVATTPPAPPVSVEAPAPVAPAAPVATVPAPSIPVSPAGEQQGQAPGAFRDFGSTVFFFEGGQPDSATVLLGQERSAQPIAPYLFRKRNSEKILITKPIFRLGRDVEFNDYAITDNVYVGHSHCHIVSRDGEYFVVDDNSKNRTSINGANIPSGQEVKLTHGCVLSVANEEFEFRLY